MNLDRAFVLLCAATISGTVSGFTCQPSTRHGVALHQQSRVFPLFSEVEQAAEATSEVSEVVEAAEATSEVSEVDEAAEATSEESSPAVVVETPGFDKTIYVGNVSFDAVEGDIKTAFAALGTVTKVQMPKDRESGKGRGFAFVAMSNNEEHIAAIEALNESEVAGRTVYVSESLPKDEVADSKKKYKNKRKKKIAAKIYIGNLNFDTTEEALTSAFEEYGAVENCYMPIDYDGNPRGFAFIQMSDEDCEKAIEGLNGSELDGRRLNVNMSLPKGQKAPPSTKQTKLYVGNLSWGTEEDALRELFEEYGKVIDSYLPVDRDTGQHRGFAFVTMAPDDALRAADETDGYELDGRILRVNEAQPKSQKRDTNYDSYDGDDAYNEGEAYDEPSWGKEGDEAY